MSLNENDLWLLSYYRSSEIAAALFFGRVARTVKAGKLQAEVTHHFADEANHARYWNECVNDLDANPIKLRESYQDEYLQTIGMPANLMEVMAITQVLEKRVIGQYRQHLRLPGVHPRIRQTIEKIMIDERWHIQYVRDALTEMEGKYGADNVAATVARFTKGDDEVYAKRLAEYGERIAYLRETNEPYEPPTPPEPPEPSEPSGLPKLSGLDRLPEPSARRANGSDGSNRPTEP